MRPVIVHRRLVDHLTIVLAGVVAAAAVSLASAAEVIPAAPKKYFNDYASVVDPAMAERLNATLENFERTNSSQIVVAIFPKMQSDSSIEDYTVRVFNAWEVGRKQKNNGAVLFVFIESRQMRIQTGYGLEGALPDALCKRIIEDEIKPHFRRGDYTAGLSAGVNAILQGARGEYKGVGRTVNEERGRRVTKNPARGWIILGVFLLLMILSRRRRRGTIYGRQGRSLWGGGFWPMVGWGGGGGWSGGGGGGFSGGGFSGGGGSSGGGGASGSW